MLNLGNPAPQFGQIPDPDNAFQTQLSVSQ